jgi:hypothetical protein
MSSYRAFEIRKQHSLANFKVPVWKQKPKESWRAHRPGNDPEHLVNIRRLQCTVCGEKKFLQAHHLRSGPAAKQRGVAMKAPDRFAVPLCPPHHEEHSHIGSRREMEWFAEYGIDCHALAEGLWNRRGDRNAMLRVLHAHQLAAAAQKARTSQPY